jgi:serine protease inhibitor
METRPTQPQVCDALPLCGVDVADNTTPPQLLSPMIRPLFLALALVVVSVACSSPTESAGSAADSLHVLPRPLTTEERVAIDANNRFAFDLFQRINARFTDTNVFISPLSASFALGMTMNGAAEETYDGMRQALHFGDASLGRINAAYRDLIALLLELDPSVDMRIGNAIWYRHTFPFHQSFFDTVSTYFGARVSALDFTSPATIDRINAWADTATNGKIPRVIDEISDDLVMLLMNAMYFKGSWRSRFDPAETRSAPFATEAHGPYSARMMRIGPQPMALAYHQGVIAVDLLYGRAAFTMTAMLPPPGVDVDDFIASLDEERWNAIVGGLHQGRAELYFPRFQMKWEDTLNSDLAAMGMHKAFTPYQADFSRMSPAGKELFISFVKQNTFVNVNEEGTEAAAVTTVGVEVVSLPPSIRFDRPFAFVIRERLSGTILFMGKVAIPISGT